MENVATHVDEQASLQSTRGDNYKLARNAYHARRRLEAKFVPWVGVENCAVHVVKQASLQITSGDNYKLA